MKVYNDEKTDIRDEDWFDNRWTVVIPLIHTPIDGQAIGTYEVWFPKASLPNYAKSKASPARSKTVWF
jgi:hypothetical protein